MVRKDCLLYTSPFGDEKAEEGTVNLALGLGKYIVDGGMTLRFSPYHPNQVLQTSEMVSTAFPSRCSSLYMMRWQVGG